MNKPCLIAVGRRYSCVFKRFLSVQVVMNNVARFARWSQIGDHAPRGSATSLITVINCEPSRWMLQLVLASRSSN